MVNKKPKNGFDMDAKNYATLCFYHQLTQTLDGLHSTSSRLIAPVPKNAAQPSLTNWTKTNADTGGGLRVQILIMP